MHNALPAACCASFFVWGMGFGLISALQESAVGIDAHYDVGFLCPLVERDAHKRHLGLVFGHPVLVVQLREGKLLAASLA